MNTTNPEIIGIYNGLGTNKARKYLGFIIGSGKKRFFLGLYQIEKCRK